MKDRYEVLILAGGYGTRMSSLFPDIPKPMIPIIDKPILEHLILECKKYGFKNILILLHFEASKIMNYFGDGSKFGIKISYEIEDIPLGTAGALLSVLSKMQKNFLTLYADVFSKVNLNLLYSKHLKSKSALTVVAHPNSHPHDSDILLINSKNEITGISRHPHSPNLPTRNMVNAAMYVFNRDLININLNPIKSDIAQDFFPLLIQKELS